MIGSSIVIMIVSFKVIFLYFFAAFYYCTHTNKIINELHQDIIDSTFLCDVSPCFYMQSFVGLFRSPWCGVYSDYIMHCYPDYQL